VNQVEKYLLIPLDDSVVFPNMTVTLPLDTAGEQRILLVPRHESVYAKVGTLADVVDSGRLPGGGRVVTLSGRARALLQAAETGQDGRLYVEAEERPDETPAPVKTRELETEYRAVVAEILELRNADASIGEFLRSITDPGALADTCAYSPDLTFEQRVELLETLDVVERLELALKLQRERLAELQVRRRIREDVESGAQRQ
jgi:ATP-dependent Lon protease